jgi:hypothetical protein
VCLGICKGRWSTEEKKYPAVCDLLKRLGTTVGGEVQTGPRPYEGDVELLRGQALRLRTMRWVTNSSEEEREGEIGRETLSIWFSEERA